MTAVTHAEPGAVDCVLLDVDGTLIDSTYLHALAWQRAFARHQLDVPWWETHFAIGMGGDLLVPHLGGPAVEERIGEQLRAQWAEEYRAVLPEVRAIPGAADLVGHLVAAGHRVALASSGADEFTDAALSLLGLDRDDFAAVTSSDDAERSKPAPDLLRAAMDSAGGSTAVLVGTASGTPKPPTRCPYRSSACAPAASPNPTCWAPEPAVWSTRSSRWSMNRGAPEFRSRRQRRWRGTRASNRHCD